MEGCHIHQRVSATDAVSSTVVPEGAAVERAGVGGGGTTDTFGLTVSPNASGDRCSRWPSEDGNTSIADPWRAISRHCSDDSVSTSASSTPSITGEDGTSHLGQEKVPAQAVPAAPPVPSEPSGFGKGASASFTDRRQLVFALGKVYTHMASLGQRRQKCTPFHSSAVARWAPLPYLARIAQYYMCSDQVLVSSLVYVDRLVKMSDFVVSPWSLHRVIMTSVMVAAKFWDDLYYSNSHYAKVGGVSVAECCILESHFLRLIDWRLLVSVEEYDMYLQQVLLVAGTQDLSTPPLGDALAPPVAPASEGGSSSMADRTVAQPPAVVKVWAATDGAHAPAAPGETKAPEGALVIARGKGSAA